MEHLSEEMERQIQEIAEAARLKRASQESVPEQGSITPLRSLLRSLNLTPSGQALPDEAQCPTCRLWDTGNPTVREILLSRDPTGHALSMAQCECPRVEERRRREEAQRWADSHLPHPQSPRTLDGFSVVPGAQSAVAAAEQLIQLKGPAVLLLVGQTGSGKSHLLEAIGRACLELGRTVRYDTASAFLDRLRSTIRSFDHTSMQDVVAWYQGRDVLLLDDLGTRVEKDWAVEKLTELIDERMRMGWRTAIATNLGREELAEAVGERLASRLYQTREDLNEVARVTLTSPDYRVGPQA